MLRCGSDSRTTPQDEEVGLAVVLDALKVRLRGRWRPAQIGISFRSNARSTNHTAEIMAINIEPPRRIRRW